MLISAGQNLRWSVLNFAEALRNLWRGFRLRKYDKVSMDDESDVFAENDFRDLIEALEGVPGLRSVGCYDDGPIIVVLSPYTVAAEELVAAICAPRHVQVGGQEK